MRNKGRIRESKHFKSAKLMMHALNAEAVKSRGLQQ